VIFNRIVPRVLNVIRIGADLDVPRAATTCPIPANDVACNWILGWIIRPIAQNLHDAVTGTAILLPSSTVSCAVTVLLAPVQSQQPISPGCSSIFDQNLCIVFGVNHLHSCSCVGVKLRLLQFPSMSLEQSSPIVKWTNCALSLAAVIQS
jgi:hypothetical protein